MTDRTDPYTSIHKALRKELYEVAVQLGRVDASATNEWNEAQIRLRALLELLRSHSVHEERYIEPLLGQWTGRYRLNVEHEELNGRLNEIDLLLRRCEDGTSHAAFAELYSHWNAFVAAYVMHLDFEETQALVHLWESVDESQLRAAHHALVSSLSPEESQRSLLLLCEAESPLQIQQLFSRLRGQIGEDGFTNVTGLLRARSQRGFALATTLDTVSDVRQGTH